MKHEVHATKRTSSSSNINGLITPEMRRQICELKRGLEQCGHPLFWHLGSLDTIVEALETARQSAECLLADDPFEAWDKIGEDEWAEFGETTEKQEASKTAAPNVHRMITRPMRQRLVESVRRLDEYYRCITELLDDLNTLKTFHTALGYAEDLQSDRPLEIAGGRKR